VPYGKVKKKNKKSTSFTLGNWKRIRIVVADYSADENETTYHIDIQDIV